MKFCESLGMGHVFVFVVALQSENELNLSCLYNLHVNVSLLYYF